MPDAFEFDFECKHSRTIDRSCISTFETLTFEIVCSHFSTENKICIQYLFEVLASRKTNQTFLQF